MCTYVSLNIGGKIPKHLTTTRSCRFRVQQYLLYCMLLARVIGLLERILPGNGSRATFHLTLGIAPSLSLSQCCTFSSHPSSSSSSLSSFNSSSSPSTFSSGCFVQVQCISIVSFCFSLENSELPKRRGKEGKAPCGHPDSVAARTSASIESAAVAAAAAEAKTTTPATSSIPRTMMA